MSRRTPENKLFLINGPYGTEFERAFTTKTPAQVLLFDKESGRLSNPRKDMWRKGRELGPLLRSKSLPSADRREVENEAGEAWLRHIKGSLADREADYIAEFLFSPPAEKEKVLDRQRIIEALVNYEHLDELVALKNKAYDMLGGVWMYSGWFGVGVFDDRQLIELIHQGQTLIPAWESIDGPIEEEDLLPLAKRANTAIVTGMEALGEILIGHGPIAKTLLGDIGAFMDSAREELGEIIPKEEDLGKPYEPAQDGRFGKYPLSELDEEALKPTLLRLGAVLEVARKIRDDGWGKLSFDETKPAEYKKGWNIKKPKNSQTPNDSVSDQSVAILSGANKSGKSFAMETDFYITLVSQSFGYAPVEAGNARIQKGIVYIDRGMTDSMNDLSAFMSEIKNWQVFLEQIGAGSKIYIDEGFSTTSPEDQAKLLLATVEFMKRRGGTSILATHNDYVIDRAEQSEGMGIYHLVVDVGPDGKPIYHYRLETGRQESLSFTIARGEGFPDSTLEIAEGFYSKSPVSPDVMTTGNYPRVECFSEDEREAMKREVASLEHLFPTQPDDPMFKLYSRDPEFSVGRLLRSASYSRPEDPDPINKFIERFLEPEVERKLIAQMVLWMPEISSRQVLERQKMIQGLLQNRTYDTVHDLIKKSIPGMAFLRFAVDQPIGKNVKDYIKRRKHKAKIKKATNEERQSAHKLIALLKTTDSVYLQQVANLVDLKLQSDEYDKRGKGDGMASEVVTKIKLGKLNHVGGRPDPFAGMFGDVEESGSFHQALQQLDALCLLADTIEQTGFSNVEFNDSGSVELTNMFSTNKPKDEAVSNTLSLDSETARVHTLVGPNGSGKTFHEKSSVLAILLGLATGYAPADYATMPIFDSLVYLDRVTEKQNDRESAFSQEIKYWNEFLRLLGRKKAVFAAVDEGFSTTSPSYQSAFSYAVVSEVLQSPHFLLFSTHNHDFVNALESAGISSVSTQHFQFSIVDGKVQFAYKLTQGHETSHAIEVARTLGFPEEILSAA